MGDAEQLAWRIVQELFYNEDPLDKFDLEYSLRLPSPAIDSQIINSTLYRFSPATFVTDGVTPGTKRPLWKLSEEAREFMETLFRDDANRSRSPSPVPGLFCNGTLEDGKNCGSLLSKGFCDTEGCNRNPMPPQSVYVPPEIKGGENKSILKLFNYRAGKGTKEEHRHWTLLKTLQTKFWTPEGAKNKNYVSSFGPPNSKTRCSKIIDLLGGFNVANTLQNRIDDIAFLEKYCKEIRTD